MSFGRSHAHSFALLSLGLILAVPATAQPIALDALWPSPDGLRRVYEGHYEETLGDNTSSDDFTATLTFEGTAIRGGVSTQNLVGRIDGAMVAGKAAGRPAGLGPLESRLWIARPELRETLRARASRALGFWPFLLLSPANSNVGFRKTASAIGLWRDEIAAHAWLYLVEPKGVGPNFTLQLVPDLANDVFLYGTVAVADASVRGLDGSIYTHAWVVDYVVDMGEGIYSDEDGNPLGTVSMQTTGRVIFASDLGPVGLLEQTEVVEVDCPDCPFAVDDVISQGTLSLSGQPVSVETTSWSQIKTRY